MTKIINMVDVSDPFNKKEFHMELPFFFDLRLLQADDILGISGKRMVILDVIQDYEGDTIFVEQESR